MAKLTLKNVSVESFARLGFWFGIVLGALGVIVKIISPQSKVVTGIPFFTFSPYGNFFDLILFFVLSILFSVIDFILLALIINLILYLSKGVDFYVEK